MAAFSAIAGLLAGVVGGVVGGLRLGAQAAGNTRKYWWLNAAVFAVGMVLNFAGLVLGWRWLAYGALGAMGGTVAGLRYGFSENTRWWNPPDPGAARSADASEDAPDAPRAVAGDTAADAPDAADGD